MKLFIAEKPSVARAIISEIGSVKKYKGYEECRNDTVVTWCFGHLLEQAEPNYYLGDQEKKARWALDTLPIIPTKWRLEIKADKKAQVNTIGKLLKKASVVVNCGDPDKEGQLLVDELLDYFSYKGKVLRFWVSAQDSASIRKGLASLKPNENYIGMKLAALGRSRADWLLGMNLTRLYTLIHSKKLETSVKKNSHPVVAVGRVQTPTLAIVALRDKEIENFKPVPYFVFNAQLEAKGVNFTAKWKPSETQPGIDSENRLIDFSEAKKLYNKIKDAKEATVVSFLSAPKKKSQPRPYSLAQLQLEASEKYGFSAEDTLKTCQSLYETHKAASYPRTDCSFLPESQFESAPSVIKAISLSCPALARSAASADPTIKSESWNDKKITAHHGIIPTVKTIDWASLNEKEQRIYELIARRYLANFYPAHEFISTDLTLKICGELFRCSGKVVTKNGWKDIDDKSIEAPQEPSQSLPFLKPTDICRVNKLSATQEKTKAPASFTEGTLISAMENIYRYVEAPEYKKLLKDGDGIGTPATRAAIISELKNKGYLETKGKKVHATVLGMKVLSLVSPLMANPVLTALFERYLKDVESGKMKLDEFLKTQIDFLTKEVIKGKSSNE